MEEKASLRNDCEGTRATDFTKTTLRKAEVPLCKTVNFKKRLLHTIVFYFGFFVFGWVVGQRGATFLDLLLITGTDVTLGSIFFMLAGLASIAGGLAGGFLLDLSGRPLLMITAMFVVNAAVNSTLALCEPLALMSALYFVSHFAFSVYDVVISPHLASIWPISGGDSFLQGLHFSFSVGAVLSPLATQPFLAPRLKDTHLIPIEELEQEFGDYSYEKVDSVLLNETYTRVFDNMTTTPENIQLSTANETKVFYALLISGCLCGIVAIFMIILMCFPVEKLKHDENSNDEGQLLEKLKNIYYAALVMLGLYNFFGSSVEDVFPHYLMTFVVRELAWSKKSGAHITSVYWVGLSVGRLCGVGLVRLLTPTKILIGCLSSMMISLTVLLLASIFRVHWLVWVVAGAVGLSTSVFFPTGLIYAHQRISRLTGKLAALIFTTPMMAATVNPLIIATLMTRYDGLWYIYIFLLQTALACACFLVLHVLSCKLERFRRYQNRSYSVDAEIREGDSYQIRMIDS